MGLGKRRGDAAHPAHVGGRLVTPPGLALLLGVEVVEGAQRVAGAQRIDAVESLAGSFASSP